MKLTLALLLSLFTHVAWALPLVSAEQFYVGATWVWNYYKDGDHQQLHSLEKYTVTAVQGDRITFDITTQQASSAQFTPSARFHVKLSDCLRSFRGGRHHFFTVELQGYANGQWSEGYQMKSLAFEEKFNCNPIEYPRLHPVFRTNYQDVETPWGEARVFQQKSVMPSQVLSYYFLDQGHLTGVAFKKEFNRDSAYSYGMELSEAY